MRWLRFIALIIFVYLSAYALPFVWNSPTIGNIIITLIFIGITVWIGKGFFKKETSSKVN